MPIGAKGFDQCVVTATSCGFGFFVGLGIGVLLLIGHHGLLKPPGFGPFPVSGLGRHDCIVELARLDSLDCFLIDDMPISV